MRKLLRFVSIIVVAAMVASGAVLGLVYTVGGAATRLATATPATLAPLGTSAAQPSVVYADDGKTVLAVLRASVNRKPVKLSQVSPLIIHAVLDTEDHRFYQHGGIDLPSTLRALVNDSTASGGIQGGSTITQQLVKNTYLNSERKISRKIKEAVLSVRLEKRYSKNRILDAYLNTIYLGHGAYGVEAASEVYFGVHASQVTLPEAAMLAGLIQNPNGYDPLLNPTAARIRRGQVLDHMVAYHSVTRSQADAANASPLPTTVHSNVKPVVDTGNGYYTQIVISQLLGSGSPLGGTYQARYNALFEGGLKIYTNFDPTMQADAENAINSQIVAVGAPYGDTGALAAVDPPTGKVRALVGGPNFKTNPFDLATQAFRQPGSGFKLFTLLAAYEQGYSPNDTIDGTAPCPVGFPGPYGNGYLPPNKPPGNAEPGAGVMTIDDATANSVNCAFIRLAQHVGLDNIIHQAELLGVTTDTTKSGKFLPYPSVVIGGEGVTVLGMADAYATIADNGVYHAPSFIDHISAGGKVIYHGAQPGKQVVPTQVDEEVLQDLQHVVQKGTGTGAAIPGRQVAGKTGTTDQSTDAWFNGITPQMAASVWMGNPKGDSATYGMHYGAGGQVYGGSFPASAWQAFMSAALGLAPAVPFPSPNPSLIPPGRFLATPGTGGVSNPNHNNNNGNGNGNGNGGGAGTG